MDEQQEIEWENQLAENIQKLAENDTISAISIEGTTVCKKVDLLLINTSGWKCASTGWMRFMDPITKTVVQRVKMLVMRSNYSAVALPNGDVAVFGGRDDTIGNIWLSSCEVFNATTELCSHIGDMSESRCEPAAILLPNGLVFISGGHGHYRKPRRHWYESSQTTSCEFYSPYSNTFFPSKAVLGVPRHAHTASLLANGKVLLCGGIDMLETLNTTEIYDPSTDSFSAGPQMIKIRCDGTATTLADGRILVTGGESGYSSRSTEIYDPETNSFTLGPDMFAQRHEHYAVLLPDGRVLIAEGDIEPTKKLTEIYDPKTNSFTCFF